MVEERIKYEVAKKIAARLSLFGRQGDIRYVRRVSGWTEIPLEDLNFVGISKFLKEVFKRAKIPKGETALYLGPLRKDLAKEVEKTGWFSKILYLDAAKEQLSPFGNIFDPYKLGRLRFDVKKNLHDEYEQGVWHIITRKSGIHDIVTYEFTPFLLISPAFQLNLFKALASGNRFIFMAHDPAFQVLINIMKGLGKSKHLNVKVYRFRGDYLPSEKNPHLLVRVPSLRVAVLEPTDTLRKVAQAVVQVLHTTPIHPERGVTINYVKEHLDRLLRARARDKKEYEEMWGLLHYFLSVDPVELWRKGWQKT